MNLLWEKFIYVSFTENIKKHYEITHKPLNFFGNLTMEIVQVMKPDIWNTK